MPARAFPYWQNPYSLRDEWSKAWQTVPDGQVGVSNLQTGRHTPVPTPASVPDGMTQLRPAAQPAFCMQLAPAPPGPGQAQSVVSPE